MFVLDRGLLWWSTHLVAVLVETAASAVPQIGDTSHAIAAVAHAVRCVFGFDWLALRVGVSRIGGPFGSRPLGSLEMIDTVYTHFCAEVLYRVEGEREHLRLPREQQPSRLGFLPGLPRHASFPAP